MAGGLLNLVAYGTKNIIVNGNASKNLFKTTYQKYTNFGMQKFQIFFNGQRSLRLSSDSVFSFSIDRYADMLMDTCFTIDLPHIWSPMYVNFNPNIQYYDPSDSGTLAAQPYEFKWIPNLGCQLIRSVKFKIGVQVISQFSGQYLYNMIQRDYTEEKKDLLDKMTGNTADLNDPANFSNRKGHYPTSFAPYNASWGAGLEPSIRGRKLYIPLNIWNLLNSSLAFPLAALNFNLLEIEVTCRSIRELLHCFYLKLLMAFFSVSCLVLRTLEIAVYFWFISLNPCCNPSIYTFWLIIFSCNCCIDWNMPPFAGAPVAPGIPGMAAPGATPSLASAAVVL